MSLTLAQPGRVISPLRRIAVSPQVGLALAALLWAGNFVIGRALRGQIDPLELNFWRWLIALAVLLPFTAAGLVRQWSVMRLHPCLVLALGFTGIALPHTCSYAALQTTSPVNALLLLNLAPLVIALGAWRLFGQPIRGWQWFGMALSTVGAVTLILRGSLKALLTLELVAGDLWMLPAVAGAAAHVLLLKRTPPGVTQGPLLAASVAAALLMMLPLLRWRGELNLPTQTPVLASLAYVGVMASAVAFLLWNRGVASIGPARAAPFMYLMPLYGSVLAFAFLGDTVQSSQVAGGALVLLGLWLARPSTNSGSGPHAPARRGHT